VYDLVFPEDEFKADAKVEDKSKVYKIQYSVNLLGQTGMFCEKDYVTGEETVLNEDVNLMSLCEETEELDIFKTKAIQDIIHYRWDTYAKNLHLMGLFFTTTYITSVILYVIEGYIEPNGEH